MNNYFDQQTKRLSDFKSYLIKEKKLSELTARDYVRRIVKICDEEGISLEALIDNVKKYEYDYTEGEKIEQGKRSHNSYRSAIIHFAYYILNNSGTVSPAPTVTPRYHFDIYKVPNEHFAIIKLIDTTTNQVIDTDTTISKEHHTAKEVSRDISSKCLNMLLRTVYPHDNTVLVELLQSLNVSMSLDGEELF